jgi:Immunoglobulin domain
MPFTFGEDAFNPGDSVAVNCMVSKGDLPLEIMWTLNKQPVVSGENNILVTRMSKRLSSLSIEAITNHHRGVFECTTKNLAGATSHSAMLIVNGNFDSLERLFCS